jgi:hypothetical protein
MTLWQDQPPQTRRQARENERSAALKENNQLLHQGVTDEPAPPAEITEVVTPFGYVPEKPQADPVVREEAPVVREEVPVVRDETPVVREEAPPRSAAPVAADARFGAPVRPQIPNYEASFDSLLAAGRADAESAADPDSGPTSADDNSDDRDWAANSAQGGTETLAELFSPDTGETAEVAAESELFRVTPDTGELEPVTKPVTVVPRADPLSMPWGEEFSHPQAGPESTSLDSPERTLTRRELRAILQAQEANAQATGHVESDVTDEAHPATPPVAFAPQAPIFSVPPAPSPFRGPPAAASTPVPEMPRSAVQVDEVKQPYQPPVGHWSTAGELDDKNQPFDQIISRSVGQSGAATTTNALILPSIPSASDATGPLTSTGEILVTGSIDLPRGLGSTGQHPDHYDTAEMDRMFDQAEGELNASNVSPIRASRAVSGHTSTRGVITPPKKSRGRLPLILSITAGVLLLGVVTLLIAGYVLKVF